MMSEQDQGRENNPLLEDSTLKHQALPFPHIQTHHFLPALKEGIKESEAEIEKIKSNPEAPNFSNTIETLEMSSDTLEKTAQSFYNLLHAHSNDKLQDLATKFGPKLATHSSNILLDKDLFSKVQTVYTQRKSENLNAEKSQLLKDTYDDFVRNGALLQPDKQKRLRAIDQRLSQLSPIFSKNVLKDTNSFQLHIPQSDTHHLKGLPPNCVEMAALTAKENKKPGWIFTLHAPSLVPFLKYAQNRQLRQKIWMAHASRGLGKEANNLDILLEIVQLRHEKSSLLGFENYAQYVLQRKMAQTPKKVMGFLEEILEVSKRSYKKELEELKKFAAHTDNLQEIKPWDFSYYCEKLKKSLFDFDEQKLRPYFSLDNVIQGIFLHAQKLYGLTFLETRYPTYHENMTTYEVFDEKSGDFMGLFYMDLFPRASKSGGAWKTSFYEQGYFKNKLIRPHVSIVCNFTKPTAQQPSLLTFQEVRTLFHEFGHALHTLLSKCHYRSLSGTSVLHDFVELPSQIMENWALEKESLHLFAKHYQTHQPIPDSMIEKLKKSHRFMTGYHCLRQVNFGLLDMAWHTTNPDQIQSVEEFELKATARSRCLAHVKNTLLSSAFEHIFAGGYAAGYYGYQWAQILDADAFEAFKQEGLFNPDTAHRFRTCVLEKGGTEPPMELYKKFKGREPNPTAFFKRNGFL